MPQAVVAAQAFIYAAVGTTAAAVGASSATAAAIATAAVVTTTAAAKVALLAGLNAVVANQNKPRPQGGMIRLTVNPDEPRRLQIGTRMNGGVLSDWYVGAARNQHLYMVVYLGEGPMGRITKVYGGGRVVYSTPITHGVRTVIPNYRSGGDRLWITYYDGRPGQAADSYLVAQALGWNSNCVGTGCAYAIIEAHWDSDNLTSPPQIAFEMEGAKFYDRRLDTTAGGSGSHRIDDPSTWALSDNPAVALDHYLLGRYAGDIKTFGVGLPAEDVPYAEFAALANLCDEDVTLSGGGTQDRYRANGFLFADRTYADTIKDLCRAMNARPADFGGRIGIIDGEEKTPVLTLYDADVMESVPEQYLPKRTWADLVNVVRGVYQNPAQNYQSVEYPRVEDAAWLAMDGGSPKEATLDLEMETNAERAQRLAWLHAKRERRQARLSGAYALRAIELEQGDWFIRSGGIFGEGKTFEVIDRVLDPRTMTVSLSAFEVDAADTAWTTDIPVDPPPDAIASEDTLADMEVPDLTVTGVTLAGTAAQLPAIRVQWSAPEDPRVRQIVVEAVPEAGGVPVSQTVDYATGEVVFTNGITDDTDYLVRARFTGQYIPSDWTANFEVTTLGDYAVGVASSVPWSGLTGSVPDGVNNALVPNSGNRLFFTNFEADATGWYTDSGIVVTLAPVTNAGIRFLQLGFSAPAIPRGPTIWSGLTDYLFNVVAGERLSVSLLHRGDNIFQADIYVRFFDSSGASTDVYVASAVITSSVGTFQAFCTAPTGAVKAQLRAVGQVTAIGFGNWEIGQPMIAGAHAAQTTYPPYSVGRNAFNAADVTAANTAAAITGQGWGATASETDASNALVDGRLVQRGTALNANPNFTYPSAAPGVPFGWSDWINGSTIITTARPLAMPGLCAYMNSNASEEKGCHQQLQNIYDGDRFVVSAEVRRSTGSTSGAGVFVWWLDASGTPISGDVINFGTAATTAGAVTATPNGVVRYEKLVTAPTNARKVDIYAMNGWGGFGQPVLACELYWLETKIVPVTLIDELGADVTGNNTAPAIVGQGWGATAPESDVSNALVPAYGANIIRSTHFEYPTLVRWASSNNTTGLAATLYRYTDSNAEAYLQYQATGTATGVHTLGIRNSETLNKIAVTAGQRYELSADFYINPAGCTCEILGFWRDAAGSTISSFTIGYSTVNGSWTRAEVFATAPSNAAAVLLLVRVLTFNGALNPFVAWRRPMVARARADQTAFSPYIPGAESDLNSDVTATGTAAGIAGQGALATLNTAGTAQIAANAVSLVSSAYTAGTTGGTAVGDGWTRYQSVTITTAGGALIINAALKGTIASDTSNASQSVRIRRGTTTLYSCSPFNQVTGSADTVQAFSATITDAPAAGTYTYYIETTYSGADISINQIANRALVITELKR